MKRSNTFEGGTDTVAITAANSGGLSGDAFQAVTGTLCLYSAIQARGLLSMQIAEPGTYASAFVPWTTLGAITTDVWGRFYAWFPANPAATGLKLVDIRATAGAACGFVALQPTGRLQLLNAAQSGTAGGTVAIALNQWVRIEFRILPSTTVGTMTWWLYNTPDAPLGSHDDTATATGMVLGANVDAVRFGANTIAGPANLTWYMDELAISDAGQIGPTASGGGGGDLMGFL